MNNFIFQFLIFLAIISFPTYQIFFSRQARETRELAKENKLLKRLNKAIEENDIETAKQIHKESKMPVTRYLAEIIIKPKVEKTNKKA